MTSTEATDSQARISGPKNGILAIRGKALTMAALPAAVCTATVTV
ncbi:MAG TPA: hypothetical protein VH478_03955 [Trebonia sp.]|jgi:hypothetical protein|nr:hypothetical protein [Trebonia sp.]